MYYLKRDLWVQDFMFSFLLDISTWRDSVDYQTQYDQTEIIVILHLKLSISPFSISSHHHISVSKNKSPPSSAPSIELFTEYNCIFFEYSLRLWIYQFLYVIISTSLKHDFILFLFLDYLTVSKMVSLSSITFHCDAPSIYLSEWYF